MGKKSKPPDPPDLKPIADAQIKIAEQAAATSAAQQGLSQAQFDYYKTQSAQEIAAAKLQSDRAFGLQTDALNSSKEAQAYARTVGDAEMAAMNEQMGFAREDRKRYKDTFIPLQDKYIAEAQAYDTPARREAEAARQMADVQRQADAQRENVDASLISRGIDPSQVRSVSMLDQMGTSTAANQALTGNLARQNIEDRGRQLRASAIDLGNNLPAQSQAGYAGGTNSGNSAVSSGGAGQESYLRAIGASTALGTAGLGYTGNALNQNANLTGTPMQWAGMSSNNLGLSGNQYNNAGSMLTQGFNNSLSRYNAAQANAWHGFDTLVGAAGAAASMMPLAEGGSVSEGDGFGAGVMLAEGTPWKARLKKGMKMAKAIGDAQDDNPYPDYVPIPRAIEPIYATEGSRPAGMTPRVVANPIPMSPAEAASRRATQQARGQSAAPQPKTQQAIRLPNSRDRRGYALPHMQSRDLIPAMLAHGEYVLPADVVSALGLEKIDKMVSKYHRPNS